MAIGCPRCSVPMRESAPPAASGARPFHADHCERCGGLWIDGGELGAAHPALERVAASPERVIAVAERSIALAACPRCQGSPVAFHYFEVLLDYCPGCGGVWVDGGELVALSRSADRHEGLAAPVPEGGYREKAASAVLGIGTVVCQGCRKEVPVRECLMTSEGLRCQACSAEIESRPVAGAEHLREAVGASASSVTRGGMADLWGFLGRLASGIGVILTASARCPHCGCRRHSRCRH